MCTTRHQGSRLAIENRYRMNTLTPEVRPALLRRLAAIVYDWLLLIALFFLLGFIYVPLIGGTPQSMAARAGFQLLLLLLVWLFFCWFWTHGGQTLGMRAWRIRVVTVEGEKIGWRQASLRFAGAFLSFMVAGLGFGWAAIDRDRRTWHDYLSRTDLVLLPKPDRQGKSAGAAQQPDR